MSKQTNKPSAGDIVGALAVATLKVAAYVAAVLILGVIGFKMLIIIGEVTLGILL